MLETEIRKDFSRAYFTPLAALDHADLAAHARASWRTRAFASLEDEGIARDTGRVEHARRHPLRRSGVHADDPADRRRRAAATTTSTRRSPTASTRRTTRASATPTPARRSSSSSSARRRSATSAASTPARPGRSRRARRYPATTAGGRLRPRARVPTQIVQRDDLPPGSVRRRARRSSRSRRRRRSSRPAPRLRVDPFGSLVITPRREGALMATTERADRPDHDRDHPQRLHRRRGRDERRR